MPGRGRRATGRRAVMAFLRWAADAGFAVDEELLWLKPPRREHTEATVYHVAQVQKLLSARTALRSWRSGSWSAPASHHRTVRPGAAGTGRRVRPDARLDGPRPGRAARAIGRRREGIEVEAGADHPEAGGGDEAVLVALPSGVRCGGAAAEPAGPAVPEGRDRRDDGPLQGAGGVPRPRARLQALSRQPDYPDRGAAPRPVRTGRRP